MNILRASTALIGVLLMGCTQFGPNLISNGRGAYNQSIIESGDQQTLAMITRMRYGETMGMLAVSSVTANIRISATANADFKAWGSRAEVAGNLNPLQSGLAYEENPTISYIPIDGAEYVRELLSPIPIELTFLLLGAAPSPRGGFIALVESINGIQNPTFLSNPDDADGRFMRCVELLLEFKHRGFIHWARSSSEGPGIVVVISRYAPTHTAAVQEFLELVEVASDGVDSGHDVILPTRLSDGTTHDDRGLAITTRSIRDLMEISAASMEIPPEHDEAGWVQSYPALGHVQDLIRIRRSETAPEAAMVAVEHHGWWYYIDASDSESKQFFRLIRTLVSVRIADASRASAQLPVLTVPVSR